MQHCFVGQKFRPNHFPKCVEHSKFVRAKGNLSGGSAQNGPCTQPL